jgi:hypothetical protein
MLRLKILRKSIILSRKIEKKTIQEIVVKVGCSVIETKCDRQQLHKENM